MIYISHSPVLDGCVTPEWANDDFCDDENNTPECNYDGGACCQISPEDGWDDYCIECECKTSISTTTTVAPDESTTKPTDDKICAALPSWMVTNEDTVRIVGGQKARSPIPWQVSVRHCPSGDCHWCGGTILDEKTVLSAAHCYYKKRPNGWYVTAGVVNKSSVGQVISKICF